MKNSQCLDLKKSQISNLKQTFYQLLCILIIHSQMAEVDSLLRTQPVRTVELLKVGISFQHPLILKSTHPLRSKFRERLLERNVLLKCLQ